jgi:hypothetical protein
MAVRSTPNVSPTSQGKALTFPLVVTDPDVMEFPRNSIKALGLEASTVFAPAASTNPWKRISSDWKRATSLMVWLPAASPVASETVPFAPSFMETGLLSMNTARSTRFPTFTEIDVPVNSARMYAPPQ